MRVLRKYPGRCTHNHEILWLMMFPPGLVLKTKSELRDIFKELSLFLPTPPFLYALPPAARSHASFPRKKKKKKVVYEEQRASLALKHRQAISRWQQPVQHRGDGAALLCPRTTTPTCNRGSRSVLRSLSFFKAPAAVTVIPWQRIQASAFCSSQGS